MQLKFAVISFLIITFFYLIVFIVASDRVDKSFLKLLKDTWPIFFGLAIYFLFLFVYGN